MIDLNVKILSPLKNPLEHFENLAYARQGLQHSNLPLNCKGIFKFLLAGDRLVLESHSYPSLPDTKIISYGNGKKQNGFLPAAQRLGLRLLQIGVLVVLGKKKTVVGFVFYNCELGFLLFLERGKQLSIGCNC